MIQQDINTPKTSSLGRLFDGVAAWLGLIDQVEYEAQAAILLESLIYQKYTAPQIAAFSRCYPFHIHDREGLKVIDFNLMYGEMIKDKYKIDKPEIALKFHKTIVIALQKMAQMIGYQKVVLSGGCFQNRILLSEMHRLLGDACYSHNQVPTNDGGISLGQAYLGGLK